MIRQRLTVLIVAIMALGLGMGSAAFAQPTSISKTTATQPGSVTSATVITVHGKIVSVNRAKKLVTLDGPRGRKVTLKVQNPYNLHAAKVGEPVVVRFYEVVTIRKERPGEKVASASLKEGIATAVPGEVPGAVIGRRLQLVVSVVAIDQHNGMVTVKGPDGATEKVKARNPNNLQRLKVGDNLVVSLSQAVAISLDKEAKE
jgi:hypothetical protein